MDNEKQISWVGYAYDDLLAFPKDARKDAGFELGKVQAGLEPADWKPFDELGAGTREIRIREASGIYRVMYVAKFEEAIYVLHCFGFALLREKESGDQQAGQDNCRGARSRRSQREEGKLCRSLHPEQKPFHPQTPHPPL